MYCPIENTSFTESFWSHDESSPYESCMERATKVRCQIIETLQQDGLVLESPLMHKVLKATDIQVLWFLRPDIMQAISLRQSEEQARSVMERITSLFVGSMPESLFKPRHLTVPVPQESQVTPSHAIHSQPPLTH
jgi:hypothetical protein